jgi:hypothetical protein
VASLPDDVLAKISRLGWYWHRLRAMSPGEIVLRAQKKAYQRADAKGCPKFSISLQPSNVFPKLPNRAEAPPELLEGVRESAAAILRGDWLAFGHLPIKVDDPPNWHRDYLVGKDLRSAKSAFKLDHRTQPGGADIKIIWEPNRWYQLVRLAMAAWLLENAKARDKCIEWLHDWTKNNSPFTGLNWTSGLEVGMRLVNFTWIDVLLTAAGVPNKTLNELREEILPPHVWYAWRYKSFGSSANNHLLGELAGLILAIARWPELEKLSAALPAIEKIFEREVLLQFASDGSNREQALGYHLFSWEFAWQSERALRASGVAISTETRKLIMDAGGFYRAIKPAADPWDYGDSDNAWVTPFFADERSAATEWWRWFDDASKSPALRFWSGDFKTTQLPRDVWHVLHSYAVFRSADWFVRFDHSPLGYLSMAPHGHLDALHVSIWFRGEPIIIDPGTGAYYADKSVRNYLADWAAHNSPHLRTPPELYPKRFGTFLWGAHHDVPKPKVLSPLETTAALDLPYGRALRTVVFVPETNSIRITDKFEHAAKTGPVTTRWKFAPDLAIKNLSGSEFSVASPKCAVRLIASPEWTGRLIYNPPDELRGKISPFTHDFPAVPVQALVSPAFRALTVAPYLALESAGEGPFTLTISAA